MAFAAVSLVDFRKTALLKFSYVPLVGALLLCGVLILFGSGPGRQQREGESRTGSANRSDTAVARIVPRRVLRSTMGTAEADPRPDDSGGSHSRLAESAAHRLRGPGRGRHCRGVDVLLPAEGSRSGAVRVVHFSCGVRHGQKPCRDGDRRIGGAGRRVLRRLPAECLHDAGRPGADVAVAWDNARARRRSGRAGHLGAVDGRLSWEPDLASATRATCRPDTRISCSQRSAKSSASSGSCRLAVIFALIAIRGFRIALRAANDYGFFLATVVTLFLILPVLIMAAGMLGVIPLTGVVTPFLSYGGSAMVANFAALGMLTSIRVERPPLRQISSPFRTSVTSLASLLGVAAIALLGVLLNVQVVRADDYVVKPHLGLQADGVRRYQYNQRVLDVGRPDPARHDLRSTGLAAGDERRRRAHGARRRSTGSTGIDARPCPAQCQSRSAAIPRRRGISSARRRAGAVETGAPRIRRTSSVTLQDRLRGFDDHATTVIVDRCLRAIGADHPSGLS